VVIPLDPSEVEAEVFSETLYPPLAMVFSGGRVPASNPPTTVLEVPTIRWW
jgi:hypothetical protein